MDDLTPEAVKAARERVTQFMMLKLPGQPMMMHMGTSHLVSELDAIARDWQRLKKVEEAAHRMQTAWGNSPTGSQHCSATHEMEEALAAFRAAVEGK